MPEIYHIKIKKEYAAALIENLIKDDAIEELEEQSIELTQWQKDALDKELLAIKESNNYTIPWDNIKHQFKQPE